MQTVYSGCYSNKDMLYVMVAMATKACCMQYSCYGNKGLWYVVGVNKTSHMGGNGDAWDDFK